MKKGRTLHAALSCLDKKQDKALGKSPVSNKTLNYDFLPMRFCPTERTPMVTLYFCIIQGKRLSGSSGVVSDLFLSSDPPPPFMIGVQVKYF